MRTVLNPRESQEARFTLQNLYYFLCILCIVAPIATFCSVHLGFQDVFWEEREPSLPSQPWYSEGYHIINSSVSKSPKLTLSYTVDVQDDKIVAANKPDEVRRLLNDPNNVLVIDLHDKKNKLSSKHVFGKYYTTIEIVRADGLRRWSDTFVKCLWQKGRQVRFIDFKLCSRTPDSDYSRKYPHISERSLLAQTKWQIFVCLAIALAVILITILVKLLLSTKTELGNTKTDLADTKEKLDKAIIAIQSSKVAVPVEESVAEQYQQKTQEETTEEVTRGRQKSPKDPAVRKPRKTSKKKGKGKRKR